MSGLAKKIAMDLFDTNAVPRFTPDGVDCLLTYEHECNAECDYPMRFAIFAVERALDEAATLVKSHAAGYRSASTAETSKIVGPHGPKLLRSVANALYQSATAIEALK